jgi:hypothetical protein
MAPALPEGLCSFWAYDLKFGKALGAAPAKNLRTVNFWATGEDFLDTFRVCREGIPTLCGQHWSFM